MPSFLVEAVVGTVRWGKGHALRLLALLGMAAPRQQRLDLTQQQTRLPGQRGQPQPQQQGEGNHAPAVKTEDS